MLAYLLLNSLDNFIFDRPHTAIIIAVSLARLVGIAKQFTACIFHLPQLHTCWKIEALLCHSLGCLKQFIAGNIKIHIKFLTFGHALCVFSKESCHVLSYRVECTENALQYLTPLSLPPKKTVRVIKGPLAHSYSKWPWDFIRGYMPFSQPLLPSKVQTQPCASFFMSHLGEQNRSTELCEQVWRACVHSVSKCKSKI